MIHSKPGITAGEILNGPVLMPCGAFISPRTKTERCQECYGRRRCTCGAGSIMPCEGGTHAAPGARRSGTSGRVNRGFVDVNHGRRGMSSR